MTDTNQLPPHTITINDHPEPRIMRWSDLELAAIKKYAEIYALQARAQATQAEVTLLTNMLESAQTEAQRLQKEVDRLQPRADVTGLLDAFDEAVAQELQRVSHVEYDSHEICKHFASKVRAILALRPAATFCGYCGGNDEDPVDHCMDCPRPEAVPMTNAQPMQPIVIAEDGRIRFKKNRIVDDLYELRKVHKLDLNEMACRNYSQEDRNQFAQLIGYSVDGWGTLSYATGVEKADAIAEALTAQAQKGQQ